MRGLRGATLARRTRALIACLPFAFAAACQPPRPATPNVPRPRPNPAPDPGRLDPEQTQHEQAEPEQAEPEPERIRVVATRRVLGGARAEARLRRTGVEIIGANLDASRALLLESVWVRPYTVRTDLRLISTESGETLEHLRGPTRGVRSGVEDRCHRLAWQRGLPLWCAGGVRDRLGCFGGRPARDAVRMRALLSGLASPNAAGWRLGLAVTRNGDALAFARHSPLPRDAEEDPLAEVSVGVARDSGEGSPGSSTMWPRRRAPSPPHAPLALTGDGTRVAIPTLERLA